MNQVYKKEFYGRFRNLRKLLKCCLLYAMFWPRSAKNLLFSLQKFLPLLRFSPLPAIIEHRLSYKFDKNIIYRNHQNALYTCWTS